METDKTVNGTKLHKTGDIWQVEGSFPYLVLSPSGPDAATYGHVLVRLEKDDSLSVIDSYLSEHQAVSGAVRLAAHDRAQAKRAQARNA